MKRIFYNLLCRERLNHIEFNLNSEKFELIFSDERLNLNLKSGLLSESENLTCAFATEKFFLLRVHTIETNLLKSAAFANLRSDTNLSPFFFIFHIL